jgi:hypothetical protein
MNMSSRTDFRGQAMECLRLAEQAKARRHKAVLLGIAQAWVQLADQASSLHAASDDGGAERHAETGLNG